ncbi:hypothetical protein [Castellaniella sp.]|uniref:hypothetical protein n=1 Tax=Castellaniella sp. TaxID=1955812 RepID=UPI002AFF37B8|nr:hypothetical protein [Castellaniella sp.]
MTDVLVDNDDVLIARNPGAGRHTLSILKDVYVEFGDKHDWDVLAELHYKGHTLAAAPRFVRCIHAPKNGPEELIGILVFGNPMTLNKGRSRVFPHLKQNQSGGKDTRLMNKRRMQIVNRFLTWNNRTVVDTMYRSAGIAYRFKNIAYRMFCAKSGCTHVESNSSMGRFNPFSIKAGMKFIRPQAPGAQEVGVDFFKHHFTSHPCDTTAMLHELEAMPEAQRARIEERLRKFYRTISAMEKTGDKMHNGMTRVNALSTEYVLKQAVQLVFGATIYWIWGPNPDHGRKLPPRIPLLAFDRQGFDDPLQLTDEELAL